MRQVNHLEKALKSLNKSFALLDRLHNCVWLSLQELQEMKEPKESKKEEKKEEMKKKMKKKAKKK